VISYFASSYLNSYYLLDGHKKLDVFLLNGNIQLISRHDVDVYCELKFMIPYIKSLY